LLPIRTDSGFNEKQAFFAGCQRYGRGVDAKKTFVTVAQLSAICGLSESWLRAEAQAGRIPNLKVGSKTMFNPSAVEKVLLSRHVESGKFNEGGDDDRHRN
jgi:hypothetical protein